MFPGQGSQTVGMGCDLCSADPLMRQTYAEASAVLGYDLEELCADGTQELLARTDVTQPALLADSVGIFRLLRREGLRFDVAGAFELREVALKGGDQPIQFFRKRAKRCKGPHGRAVYCVIEFSTSIDC